MRIAIGCDHGGFPLKARIRRDVESLGHVVVDCGTNDGCSVDYPDYAVAGCRPVMAGDADRAILICGSGVGISVAANKLPGIRAGVCHDSYSARQGVEHDDMNVICLGARIIGEELVAVIVREFLAARFTNEERHLRRLKKVLEIEQTALAGGYGRAVKSP